MNLVTEEKKYQKESETQGTKENYKKEVEDTIDSTTLFNEIYEKNIGSKVRLNVSWMFLSQSLWSDSYLIHII